MLFPQNLYKYKIVPVYKNYIKCPAINKNISAQISKQKL